MSSPPAPTPAPGVLVVDDDLQIGELVGSYLGARGFRVGTAANGAQGATRFHATHW